MWFLDIASYVKLNRNEKFTTIAEELAQNVLESVFDILLRQLDGEEKTAFQSIRDEQIDRIKPLLIKGIVSWWNRVNDRPWGIDKVIEESRQLLLSGLARKILPQFMPDKGLSVDLFIAEEIQPYLLKYSLPRKVLGRISPSAYSAKYNRK